MSDQDSFFEEEPAPRPERPAKQQRRDASRTPASPAPSRRRAVSTAPAPFFDRHTTYTVALLIAVIGLLVGVLAGYLLGSNGSAQPTVNATPAASSPAQQVPAPAAGASDSGGATATP